MLALRYRELVHQLAVLPADELTETDFAVLVAGEVGQSVVNLLQALESLAVFVGRRLAAPRMPTSIIRTDGFHMCFDMVSTLLAVLAASSRTWYPPSNSPSTCAGGYARRTVGPASSTPLCSAQRHMSGLQHLGAELRLHVELREDGATAALLRLVGFRRGRQAQVLLLDDFEAEVPELREN